MDDARRTGAERVVIWGSGAPRREFLHVDDCADALVYLLRHYSGESHVNVGCGKDVTILELAEMIRTTVGFSGRMEMDPSKPDGTPRKLLDVSGLHALGWTPKILLQAGLKATYDWYLANGKHAMADGS
jgi:GDP-L-fucose synthase